MLKIFKAEKRSSKFLNKYHEYLCEGSDIIFENQRQLKPRFDIGAKIKSVRLMRGYFAEGVGGTDRGAP